MEKEKVMVTEVDERNGTVKVYWKDIRKRVAKVEPEFAKIVDELDLDDSYPFYLVYFPYGVVAGDPISQFIPNSFGGYERLSSPEISSDIIKHLGYGMHDSPMGMVLEKNFELYIDFPREKLTLPHVVYTPGSILSFSKNLTHQNFSEYTPNGIFSISSGARSALMMPNIGCFTNHFHLKRDLNVRSAVPKQLYDHWAVFKEIANSKVIESIWRSCLVYFCEKFVHKLNTDDRWSKLNKYLYQLAWHSFTYERNHFHYDLIFSVVQKRRNLKPSPYLMDTVKHLAATACGVVPGYAPATNDDFLPLEVIQKAYIESYGMKKYHPTIMQPAYFHFEKDKYPIYYSIQYPATSSFSPKARKINSRLYELRDLEHIITSCMKELSTEHPLYAGTALSKLAKNAEFKYYHYEKDSHHVVKSSEEIPTFDKRIHQINSAYKVKTATFTSDSPFVRGCISISGK
jgi:hypothetical protein